MTRFLFKAGRGPRSLLGLKETQSTPLSGAAHPPVGVRWSWCLLRDVLLERGVLCSPSPPLFPSEGLPPSSALRPARPAARVLSLQPFACVRPPVCLRFLNCARLCFLIAPSALFWGGGYSSSGVTFPPPMCFPSLEIS